MDTMELTKIVGGLCAALLVLLMVKWGADTLYHVGDTGGHDGAYVSAYPIEVEGHGGDEAAEEGPSFEELLASADTAKGAKVFSKCKACHKLEDGKNGVGPSLFGVVDRAIASIAGFGYSDAVSGLGGDWNVSALNEFLTNPKAYAKGTKMTFKGLKKDTDRANLISYLQTVN